jgi:hypothetical protein
MRTVHKVLDGALPNLRARIIRDGGPGAETPRGAARDPVLRSPGGVKKVRRVFKRGGLRRIMLAALRSGR